MKLNIKSIRKKRRITLIKLGIITGYSKSFLSKIENNLENPRTDELEKIGHALQICPKKLILTCNRRKDCEGCPYK